MNARPSRRAAAPPPAERRAATGHRRLAFVEDGSDVLDLLQAVKTGKTVAEFVEGGPFVDALSEIGVHAAVDAMAKASHAAAPAGQVRSAVTHLESAEAALSRGL